MTLKELVELSNKLDRRMYSLRQLKGIRYNEDIQKGWEHASNFLINEINKKIFQKDTRE